MVAAMTLSKSLFCFLDDTFAFFRFARKMLGIIRIKGVFDVECRDKDGNLKWRKKAVNGVTTVGLNGILNSYFSTTGDPGAWYLGLISSVSYTALLPADTMAAHFPGWTESVNYSAITRPAWGPGAAAAGSMTNAVAVAFTMTAGETIKGFFCVNDNVKNGTGGILWATALFATDDQTVVASDVLNVTYTITMS
jgi:hypothetical protein